MGDRVSQDLRDVVNSADASERVSVILQGEDLKNEALNDFIKSSGARVSGSYAGLGAQALEIPAPEFEKIWADLPLDDLRLADFLGATRQQVINLRKTARERLLKRMSALR